MTSFDSIDNARFVPGTILADRYRIVGLLGKGGMGEVYRADDLKLGQPVALKFLPDHLLTDGAALARFHREVRVARQVSHKNVCRVYDIGEVEGRHFLSMEFIKGEELSSLMRRIGRLPQDKALQLARQICAGLAAAHDVGFLHRDLKPSNIMIDGDGNARILDFGLGGLVDEFAEDEVRAGTPAYMSPEQIEGKEQTIQSDIYSLGLVLYELFTGKRAFEASSLHELIKLRRSHTSPTTPTDIVKDLDPVIVKVIDRCIQKDPQRRPSSALQVAAALPGGDPLAAALAAGETPSPEMVAAAPTEGVLRPAVAIALLTATVILIALSSWLTKYQQAYRLTPLNESPEVLRVRARDLIKKLGYQDASLDSAHGFVLKEDYLKYIADRDQSATRWQKLAESPGPYRFWYRQSPRYFDTIHVIEFSEPALDVSGMTSLYLDMDGHLHWFVHVPPQREPVATDRKQPDWSLAFHEAGLDIANFRPSTSTWVPLHAYDLREAWDGPDPLRPATNIHVEAASFHGAPVYFETIYPWDRATRQEQAAVSASQRFFTYAVIAVFIIALVGSAVVARRNLRAGRGDVSGATRVAFVYFTVRMVVWIFDEHHNGFVSHEFSLFATSLAFAVFTSFFLWLLYIALEPFVRRRWPQRIISWSRLLRGDFRDPLVGRDLLIGAAAGGFAILAGRATSPVLYWLGRPFDVVTNPGSAIVGAHFSSRFASQLTAALFLSFITLFLLLLFVVLLRREWLGLAALWILFVLFGTGVSNSSATALPAAAIGSALTLFILYRYGLLALCTMMFFLHLWVFYPMTTSFTAWYAFDFVIGLVICLALAVYGFYTSLAGQSVFGRKFLQD
ncbi:MAG TPA: serine/threonine-protein kinase [Pyrinomonadaceae bacterium]|nr:serine/threonine-protein kinase [Pyrinomonadaceae bacterium]